MTEPKDKVILIVDDDKSVLEFLRFAVESEGFSTRISDDGNKALELVNASLPDLIILDMMLPGKSGFEIVKLLQSEKSSRIPIIIVSGKYDDGFLWKQVQFEPNVEEYIMKPINISLLFKKIHSILGTIPHNRQENKEKNNTGNVS